MYVFIMHNLPHHHHHSLPITLQLTICISALLIMITNTNELIMTHAASTQAESPLIHAHNSWIVDVNANSAAISTHHSAQALTARHLDSDGDGNNHHHNNWGDIATIIDIQVGDRNAMNLQIISSGIDESGKEIVSIDGGKYTKIRGSKSKKRGGRHGHGRAQRRRRRLRRSGGGGGFDRHVLFRLSRTTAITQKKAHGGGEGGGPNGGGNGGLFHTDYSSPHTHPPHHN